MDAARVARAVHLTIDERAPGIFEVRGGAGVHTVDLGAGTCDCTDFAVHGGPCKHLLAVRLRRGDAEALEALRAVVPMPSRKRARGTA